MWQVMLQPNVSRHDIAQCNPVVCEDLLLLRCPPCRDELQGLLVQQFETVALQRHRRDIVLPCCSDFTGTPKSARQPVVKVVSATLKVHPE